MYLKKNVYCTIILLPTKLWYLNEIISVHGTNTFFYFKKICISITMLPSSVQNTNSMLVEFCDGVICLLSFNLLTNVSTYLCQ